MISVITGDIINSRNFVHKEWLPVLKHSLNKIPNARWEIYRGDSFQIEIGEVAKTLLYALGIKARIKSLKNVDVRMAIGIGKKGYNASKVTESSGEAYINSGEAFESSLKKQTLAIKSPWKELDDEVNISLNLALLTIDNWTVNSAEYAKYVFDVNFTGTQLELAKRIGISQSSASERRKRAGIDEVLQFEKRYKKLISRFLETHKHIK